MSHQPHEIWRAQMARQARLKGKHDQSADQGDTPWAPLHGCIPCSSRLYLEEIKAIVIDKVANAGGCIARRMELPPPTSICTGPVFVGALLGAMMTYLFSLSCHQGGRTARRRWS